MRYLSRTYRLWAVTLIEMLVVVLIISILATIATGVYSGETRRARIAAAQSLIHELSLAITRYEMDTGSLPPSGSGEIPPSPLTHKNGSGYLHLALVHSMSGNAIQPASSTWKGPYINLQTDQIAPENASDTNKPGMLNILDPWDGAILYIESKDYIYSISGSFWGGTKLFSSTAPIGANPDLPAPNPFAAGETYYNPTTYQLISFGPDGSTYDQTLSSGGQFDFAGTDEDDINNFGY